jgi:farnesyl diphosphate synthase
MKNKTINNFVLHHENVLRHLLDQMNIPASRIREAIAYTLFPGGKRLRPVLVYLCGELMNINQQSLDYIAAAIEFTHCYSLVHDDLPAMDNDDLRRGKPSCHRAFDEATAILVGDAMQILAIDILLNQLPHSLTMPQVIEVTKELVNASGPAGMISGQSLDLSELTNPAITELQLREIHLLKTGKLISSCINMVLAAGHPAPEAANALRKFAEHLGLVFQMQDDYLDQYDDSNQLGKNRCSDAANQKTTFATLYNKHDLAQLIDQHYQHAEDTLTIFMQRADQLREFLRDLHHRSK